MMDQIFEDLVQGLRKIYGPLVQKIVLYGSVARGTDTDESDVDIAVFLLPGATREMEEEYLDLVVGLELESGKVLSVVKIDYSRYLEWENTLPFYRNIQNEGKVLWAA